VTGDAYEGGDRKSAPRSNSIESEVKFAVYRLERRVVPLSFDTTMDRKTKSKYCRFSACSVCFMS
jgi:hypothetical protein